MSFYAPNCYVVPTGLVPQAYVQLLITLAIQCVTVLNTLMTGSPNVTWLCTVTDALGNSFYVPAYDPSTGVVSFTFSFPQPGVYTIDITGNGLEIKNSPFTVNVPFCGFPLQCAGDGGGCTSPCVYSGLVPDTWVCSAVVPSNSATLTGQATISGSGCFNGAVTFSGQASVSDSVYLTASGTAHGANTQTVIPNTVLDGMFAAADQVSTTAAGSTCGVTLSSISGATTIASTGSPTVVCVTNDISLSGNGALVLQGGSDDEFIINVHGTMSMSGNSGVVLDGVNAANVLWNLIGAGTHDSLTGNAELSGTVLGINRKLTLSGKASVSGAVIVGGGLIMSGQSSVGFTADSCPLQQPVVCDA